MESPTKSAIACVLFFAVGMLAGSFISDSLDGVPQERFGWDTALDRLPSGGGADAPILQPAPGKGGQAKPSQSRLFERIPRRMNEFWRSSTMGQDYRDAPSALSPGPGARVEQGRDTSRVPAGRQARTPAGAHAQALMPAAASSRSPGRAETGRFVSTLPGVKVEHDEPAPRRTREQAAVQDKRRPADFDGGRRGPGAGSYYGMAGSGLAPASLERERRAREKRKDEEQAAQPFKPPLLKDWLGKGPIKPPEGRLAAPSFSPLKAKFPKSLPDGRSYDPKTPPPAHIEKLAAPDEHPDYQRWLDKDERRRRKDEPHWHIDASNTPFYHMGKTWGRSDQGRWVWMIQSDRKWWTVGDGSQRMVRHADHWWWKTADGWFMLHQGQPWAWRHFAEWRRDGLLHPGTETRIVYSADGHRVAVITPGAGAMVFDAATGALLDRFRETRIGGGEGD
ncbi:MAG: hypothetical protein WC728_12115 [Elusimicrobiota bacterium]